MIPYRCKNTQIYKEFNEKERLVFDLSRDKFLHNIDTLYYVIRCKNDWGKCENVKSFLRFLSLKKESILSDAVDILEFGEDFIMNGMGYKIFKYDFERVDKYNVFIAGNLPNENTPSLIVQLRSQYLWLNGEHSAVRDSYLDIETILSMYNIEIESVTENRIDFAYHTNYIQDPLNFFKEENLNKMQVSRFTRASKEYSFFGDEGIKSDYLSIGRRKSNNLFVRIYDKNQEVVSGKYKQFFLYLWHTNKLISTYDLFCLEECMLQNSKFYEPKARLKFYSLYGKNRLDIELCKEILSENKKISHDSLIELADRLTPSVTLVMNIEIQTMRKFYVTIQDSIKLFDCVSFKESQLQYISKILDNKHLIHNFLTHNVIRFVDYKAIAKTGEDFTRKRNRPTAVFWKLLQKSKMYNLKTKDVDIIRKYQRNLSEEAVTNSICRMIGTWSLYKDCENTSTLIEDFSNFMFHINENDLNNVHLRHKMKKSPVVKSFFNATSDSNSESH